MTEATNYCFECKRPLVEIDNRATGSPLDRQRDGMNDRK
jgi:hypothetical protein